jgi:hypothetical protein
MYVDFVKNPANAVDFRDFHFSRLISGVRVKKPGLFFSPD